MPQTLNRPNRYAATCIRCHGRIPAGAGLLARTDTGDWAADHDGPCPDKPMVIATPVARASSDGIYVDDDGTIYKVQVAVHGSGKLYAKRLDPATGTFTYVAGAIHTLRADQRMSLHDARAFGRLYNSCVCCGRTLTDERSVAEGVGRICREKYFGLANRA